MAIQPLDIATTAAESLTLLDLQRMVRFTLEERFNVPLWVGADISELKLNRSGHCYLNLVEKGAGEGTPLAEARAVIWRSAYATLVKRFAEATGSELRAVCQDMHTERIHLPPQKSKSIPRPQGKS